MSSPYPSATEPGGPSRRWPRRRQAVAGGIVLLVAAGAAIGATDPFASGSPSGSSGGVVDNQYPTSTATVERQSLSQQTQVNATLGYAGSYTVAIPSGTPSATLTSDRASVRSDEAKIAADRSTLQSDEALATPDGASTLLAAEATVKSDETALAQARSQLAADRRLSCPASSSATVTSASSGTGTPSSSSPSSDTPGNTGSSATGNTGSGSAPSGMSGHVKTVASLTADITGPTGSTNPTQQTTTTTTQPATAPLAQTGTVSQTSSTSATVLGDVDPDGAATTYYVEYGTGVDYGQSTTAASAGSSFTEGSVSVTLTGLTPGAQYHYRLVATSSLGTSYGQDATLQTTAAPVAVTGSGATATATSETLSGTVNPGSADTTYYFEWGRTGAFGHRSPVTDAGAGSTAASVTATATGLRAGDTYDFRLVATSALGTSYGQTQTFQVAASSCVAEAAVVNADAEALRTARDALVVDKLGGGSTVTSARQTLTDDEQALSAAEEALSVDETQATNPNSTFTSLPAAGQVLERGGTVYELDGQAVPLFYGTTTFYRALYLGVAPGPDVTELQANLIALGFESGISASPDFTAATGAAVKAWQAALGVPATGVLTLGDVVVAPGPIEVNTVSTDDGAAASAGAAVLTATSTAPVVTIALDASQQSEVKVGDPVTITLPNNTTTPGVVSSVGKIATSSSSGSGNTGGSESSATITVDVTPTDPKATGNLDQAPVEVSITTASVSNALVVPVDALVPLASGGYALEEVEADGRHAYVGVSLGLFDDAEGLVQVTGSGVAAGQRVVVPNT